MILQILALLVFACWLWPCRPTRSGRCWPGPSGRGLRGPGAGKSRSDTLPLREAARAALVGGQDLSLIISYPLAKP